MQIYWFGYPDDVNNEGYGQIKGGLNLYNYAIVLISIGYSVIVWFLIPGWCQNEGFGIIQG